MALIKTYIQKAIIDGKKNEYDAGSELAIIDTTNCLIYASGTGTLFYNTASGAQIFTTIPLAQAAATLSASDLSAYT